MLNKTTLCFYQHPEALHEINSWKELVKDKTIRISQDENVHFQIVELKREDETFENLIIVPVIENQINFELTKEIIEYGLIKEYKYYKTLLFGRFNSSDLESISKFIKKHESRKN